MTEQINELRRNQGLPENALTIFEIECLRWLLRGMKGYPKHAVVESLGVLLKCGFVAAGQDMGNGWLGYAVTDAGREQLQQAKA